MYHVHILNIEIDISILKNVNNVKWNSEKINNDKIVNHWLH